MRRKIAILVGALIVLLLAIQLVPVAHTNPPVKADFDGPSGVEAVLRQSCYDCHSNESSWPWYSYVAPSSWLVTHDVEEARDHFNLSDWGSYDAKRQAKLAEEMWEEVEDGEMPLLMYRLAHAAARLTEADKDTLRAWSLASAQSDD